VHVCNNRKSLIGKATIAIAIIVLTMFASAIILAAMPIYDPATYDPRNAIPALMGRVRTALLTALDKELEPFGLKASDYVVLASVANDAACTASSVCSVLIHDPGAMTRKLDALEKKGLIRRVRSEADRRAIHLELTPEGRKLFPRVMATVVGLVNDYLHGFTKAEAREMESMLKRILANAEQRAAGAKEQAA